MTELPTQIHLVGSVGLDNAQEVFRTVGRKFGARLSRVPDGEPGPRRLWVSFQYPLLRSSPFLRPDPSGAVRVTSGFPLLCMADGVAPQEIQFGELGYAREARTSYIDFCEARRRGDVPANSRFQVCLPTPMGVIYAFCTARDVARIEPAYEAAFIREVEEICKSIPNDDLCIQWDFCHEMILWDGQTQQMFPTIATSPEEIVARIVRICDPIPDPTEVGFHLCYGDFGAKHFMEPLDARKMVEVINEISATVTKPIAYFHLPVPISRVDDEFYRPLSDLNVPDDTQIYLGLVHGKDGEKGTLQRIDVARKYLKNFGIGTECGMARARKREVIERLFDVHVAVSKAPV